MVLLVIVGAATVDAEDEALVLPPIHSMGEKLAIDTLPQVVQTAMHREGGPNITIAYRRTDATGSTVYSTHIKDTIGIHEMLTVSEDGTVLGRYQERKRDNTRGLEGGTVVDSATPPASDGTADTQMADTAAPAVPPAGSLAGRGSRADR